MEILLQILPGLISQSRSKQTRNTPTQVRSGNCKYPSVQRYASGDMARMTQTNRQVIRSRYCHTADVEPFHIPSICWAGR
eukprot:2087844-Amphidinium_carterae.2